MTPSRMSQQKKKALGRRCDGGRTGFEREGGDVDYDLGARLEDDEEHTDRAGDAVELEAIVQLARVGDRARGVRECGDVRHALQHCVPFVARAQVEPFHERRRESPRGCLRLCMLLPAQFSGRLFSTRVRGKK